MIPPDYNLGDTVYIKDGKNRYFGKVTAEVAEDAKMFVVGKPFMVLSFITDTSRRG